MMNEAKKYLNGGRLGAMYETALDGFLHRIDADHHAGVYEGVHTGGFAESEFAGKYLFTCAQLAKSLGSVGRTEESGLALAHAKKVSDSVVANQREDGYIGGLDKGMETHGFSVWNQAFTLLGLLAYYELTGDKAVLACAERIGEYNAKLFMGGADILAGGNNGSQHLSFLLPLVRLCSISGKPIFREFAQHIANAIKASDNNFFEFDSILDLRSKKGIENFVILIGILEYGELFGDVKAFTACEKYRRELAETQIRENGNGTLREVWTDGGNQPRMLGLDLRPDENCVAVGWIELNLALFYRSLDPSCIDAVERALYNHLLGALDESGMDFAYYQPNFGRRITKTAESMYKCCRYRGFSAVSHLTDMLFLRRGGALYTMVYTDSVYEDEDIAVKETSEYPYKTRVLFDIGVKKSPITLMLRIPEYVSGAALSVDGERIAVGGKGYAPVELDAGAHTLTLYLDIALEERRVTIDGVERVGYTYGCILLAAEGEGEPVIDRNASPVSCGELGFKVGGTPLTDYASAGRDKDFSVWSKLE